MKENQNTAVFDMEVVKEDTSFPFKKIQGREAVWQVERTRSLYQADLSLSPEHHPPTPRVVIQLWAY